MKKLLIVLLTLTLSFSFLTFASASENLNENEAYLYYMYSNEQGHYFLDPSTEYENVIFIGKNDFKLSKLHHGKKFIGVFEDQTKWDLENILEVK